MKKKQIQKVHIKYLTLDLNLVEEEGLFNLSFLLFR